MTSHENQEFLEIRKTNASDFGSQKLTVHLKKNYGNKREKRETLLS